MEIKETLAHTVIITPSGSSKNGRFQIVEEVPGNHGYRYFVPMNAKTSVLVGNTVKELSEYFSPKFSDLDGAKAFLRGKGIKDFDIEPFSFD